jgi:hypothetical protein
MKATALAVLAERTTPTARLVVDAPWTWNLKDVWLTRARQPAVGTMSPAMPGTLIQVAADQDDLVGNH